MVSPTTLPRFHSSVAPNRSPSHLAAAVASGTASINEITGPPVSGVIFSLLLPGWWCFSRGLPWRTVRRRQPSRLRLRVHEHVGPSIGAVNGRADDDRRPIDGHGVTEVGVRSRVSCGELRLLRPDPPVV